MKRMNRNRKKVWKWITMDKIKKVQKMKNNKKQKIINNQIKR